jgi:ABC-type sugar transport system substrate-binding protein
LLVNAALETPDLSGNVQPDDVAAGVQEMQMMADKLGGKGNVVVLQVALTQDNLKTGDIAYESIPGQTKS